MLELEVPETLKCSVMGWSTLVRDVTQKTARNAHEWISICRISIPKGLHPLGIALV